VIAHQLFEEAVAGLAALEELHEKPQGAVVHLLRELQEFAGAEAVEILGFAEAGPLHQSGEVDEHHLFVVFGEHAVNITIGF
jgi:hypothetical protein